MDADYGISIGVDVVFCRNVLIYFDHDTQQQVLSRLCSHLRPNGYLFSGHSETLNGFDLPLEQIATTVYRKIK
jgi:chemotaxis protein methyltransferase CheR